MSMTQENTSRRPKSWRQTTKELLDELYRIWRGKHGFYWTALIFFTAGAGAMFIAMCVLILWVISGNGGFI